MSAWLDRWAKRAASADGPATSAGSGPAADRAHPGGTSHSTPDGGRQDPAQQSHSTRRDFLKRAAVVGGTVWSVPVIQSAVAPAVAASGTLGQPCPCKAPVTCGGGICGGTGATCSSAAVCVSGGCSGGLCTSVGQAPAGALCSTGTACLSGVCTGGTCAKSAVGGKCTTANDCGTGVGCSSRSGQTVCGGPGATCGGTNSNCQYGNCNSDPFNTGTPATCGRSADLFGAPCGTSTDGLSGTPQDFVCEAGATCQPGPVLGQLRCRPA